MKKRDYPRYRYTDRYLHDNVKPNSLVRSEGRELTNVLSRSMDIDIQRIKT